MRTKYNPLRFLAVIILSGTIAVSCLENDDQDNVDLTPKGSVSFSNFSPGNDGLKFYSDGEPIYNNSLNYGQFHSNFWNSDIGIKSITVQNGTSILDTLNLTVATDRIYSVFAVNVPGQTELVSFEENFIVPDAGKAAIHFYQLSPYAPNLKVAIAGDPTNIGTFLFKQSSNFIEVNEVLNKRMYLIDNTTSDTLVSKFVTFSNGRSYSVIAKGLVDTTDETQDLDIQVIPYNF